MSDQGIITRVLVSLYRAEFSLLILRLMCIGGIGIDGPLLLPSEFMFPGGGVNSKLLVQLHPCFKSHFLLLKARLFRFKMRLMRRNVQTIKAKTAITAIITPAFLPELKRKRQTGSEHCDLDLTWRVGQGDLLVEKLAAVLSLVARRAAAVLGILVELGQRASELAKLGTVKVLVIDALVARAHLRVHSRARSCAVRVATSSAIVAAMVVTARGDT